MKVHVIFEGNVPRWVRIRDRIAVKLLFSGHKNTARLLMALTGVKEEKD